MFAKRLRWARESAGFSMRALAERAEPKVTAQAISKYEAGKMMPASSVLIGLGRALDVSLDFLMGSGFVKLSELCFRQQKGAKEHHRGMAEAIMDERANHYLFIEEVLELRPRPTLFEQEDLWGIAADATADDDAIEAKAVALRQKWDLGMQPISSLSILLEARGVMVFEAALPLKVDGLSCFVQRDASWRGRPAVLVSTSTNVERKRFSLAHELGHWLSDSHCGQAQLDDEADTPIEVAMNRFAAAFLMPRQHLEETVGLRRKGISRHELMQLKRLYGVSAIALLRRIGELGILPQAVLDRDFGTHDEAWRHAEPDPIGEGEGITALEHPQRFERLVWQALNQQEIAPIRAARMLGQSLDSIEAELIAAAA